MADLNAVIYRIAKGEEARGKEKKYSPRLSEIERNGIFFLFLFFFLSFGRIEFRTSGRGTKRNETKRDETKRNEKRTRREVKTPRKTANARNAGLVRSSRHELPFARG